MVELKEDSGGFIVLQDGEQIGIIEYNNSTLQDIYIDEDQRGNGYGKKAVSTLIDMTTGDINTTTVVNPVMEHILRDLGFERDYENHWVLERN